MRSILYVLNGDGTPDIRLWVEEDLKDDGSEESFNVINGAWDGIYCGGKIFINDTEANLSGYYVGYACVETRTLYKKVDGNLVIIGEF